MGRLRGAPGIVNVLLGAQVLGALRCAFGRALKRDEATAKSPAPAYGACRWCLHAPYASKLLAHQSGALSIARCASQIHTEELLCTLCFAYQGSLCTLCSDIVVYLNIAPV